MDARGEEHAALLDELSRRGFLQRAGVLGLGGLMLAAAPVAERLIAAGDARAVVPVVGDAALQAFADTMIPGRKASRTAPGNPIEPAGIPGGDRRRRAGRCRGLHLPPQARPRADQEGLPAVSPTRVDVLIAGTGFGGAISAYRLAELYAAAGVDPRNVLVLERGRRHKHTDFRQSMHVENLSEIYQLIQGQGAQIVVANGVGGGSALYLAASLRAPHETFERRDRRPDDGPDRRIWPRQISRHSLNRYYRRA